MQMARKPAKPSTNPRRALVQEQVLTKAAEIFLQHGFTATRIQDIADALSLSRSALYYYFSSKEEMLAAMIAAHTERRANEITEINTATGMSAGERLRTVLRATIMERLTGGPQMRVLDQLAFEMPAALRHNFDHVRRGILESYTAIIADGVRGGEFRAVDPRVAAFAVLGIANWTSWWYSPGGRRAPDELADMLVDIGEAGLRAGAGEPSLATNRANLLRGIRDRLDLLESAGPTDET